MIVWVVLAWDDYYPSADNIKGIYKDKETAIYSARHFTPHFDKVDVVEKRVQ